MTTEHKLKILCLHGFAQSEEIFHHKCSYMRNAFKNKIEFIFVQAPNKITENTFAWWYYSKTCPSDISWKDIMENKPEHYGLEESVKLIQSIFDKHKYFDGVLGFSQGSAFLGLLCQYKSKLKLDFKFAIFISGFKSHLLTEKDIDIPTLHIIGEKDEVIIPSYSYDLAKSFNKPNVFKHSGKHVIPSNSIFKTTLIDFITKVK